MEDPAPFAVIGTVRAVRGAPCLGVLVLDTRFPRVAGDGGHPASYPMPVRFAVVPGADADRVVRQGDTALLPSFLAAARALVEAGARAITTTCGFMVRWQAPLQAALPVPVWTSSLLHLAQLQRPGVVTVDAASLDAGLLRAAGAPDGVPVAGLTPGSALQRTLLGGGATLDARAAQAEVVEAAVALVHRHPAITDIVLECANMPPYAQAVRAATARPVHDLLSVVAPQWQSLAAAWATGAGAVEAAGVAGVAGVAARRPNMSDTR